MNDLINSKLCPACHQKNNPAFNECWKCRTSFITGIAKPIVHIQTPADGWGSPKTNTKAESPIVGFLYCVGATIIFLYMSSKSDKNGVLLLAGLFSCAVSVFYAFAIFSWFRWLIIIILGIWGLISLSQGMAAISTTDFFLILILLAVIKDE